jgi:hypothetical protein
MSNDSLSINGCQGLPCYVLKPSSVTGILVEAYFAVARFSTWSEHKGLPGLARVELVHVAGYTGPCVPSMGRI